MRKAVRAGFVLTLLLCNLLLLVFSPHNSALAGKSLPQQVVIRAQDTQGVTTLEAGKPIERELAGGEKHSYQITLAEGQYASVVVEQRGIDLIARLLGTDGKPIAEFDGEIRNQGQETVELAAEATGNYRLVVEAKQRTAPAGRYEIRLTEIRAATEKERALHEARKLISEVNRLYRASKYDQALPLADRAVAIRERELGTDHPDFGMALFSLANLYNDKGDYARAELLYRRALAIREKALGKDHLGITPILNNLGNLVRNKGDYTAAELLFQRAFDIREKLLEPDHLLIASSLNSLAIINHVKGDNVKAAILYKRALEIRENALGPEHPDVATSLSNLANIYLETDTDYDKAEPLYQRSLTIREKVLDPEHPAVAESQYNLAIYYSGRNDFAQAEPLCQRALSIFEKTYGPEHPYLAYPLNALAVIYKNIGDYVRAESLYQRAITIREKALSPYHPDIGGSLTNLANLYAVKGEVDKAIATQSRANAILEINIALNLATGSERQKLAYLLSLREIADRTLTLHLRTAPGNSEAAELALTTILQRKGRVLDAMSDSLGTLRRRLNQQDQLLFDQLNDTTSRLVRLVLNGPQNMPPAEHQQQINALEEQREKLESEISRRSAGFYEPAKSVTLNAVRDAIPAGAVLIEFSAFRPIAPEAHDFAADRSLDPNAVGSSRYVAYVVRRQGEVKWAELGEAKEIDNAIDELRQALRDPKRRDVQQLSRFVDKSVMQPVRTLLGDATQVLISPDGALNLIPFEALVDEHNRFLVERYSFSYLTSGRDLLRLHVARKSLSNPLVIVDPSFGEPGPAQVARANVRRVGQSGKDQKRKSVTTGSDLTDVYFAPLSATEHEGRAIKSLFPEAKLEAGARATESSLKRAIAPSILHIATHGFFLTGAPSDVDRRGTRTISANVRIENPLLRSGLALAGANLRQGGDDDGILSALEASGLNLWGTKLVTLSACDTGLGEVKNGEGVYGLRRAFVLAGTETLVMSLWPVSDYVTRDLMTNYYKGLKQGKGRAEALRNVQLAMLSRKELRHPFYWASFIQSGEWANLDGKRQ